MPTRCTAPLALLAACLLVAPVLADDTTTADADPVAQLTDLVPGCDAERAHCVGLVVHVAPAGDDTSALVASPAWIAEQIEVANRHFAAAEVAFEIARIEHLEPDERVIHSRTDRDVLGRDRFARGEVHVFIVGQLDNVDDDGEIRGVHWRDRDDRSHRWVIVSRIAGEATLAHELGHFFGLAHSDYDVSIMNKTRRAEPPWSERTFHDDEIETVVKRRDKMFDSGMLIDRTDAVATDTP